MISRLAFLGAVLLLAACSRGSHSASDACDKVVCGQFAIERPKESTPIYFAADTQNTTYRLCVEQGSVILQTTGTDGSARSLGGEIRAGNCSEMAFANGIYIIGNTATSSSTGFYYRVP